MHIFENSELEKSIGEPTHLSHFTDFDSHTAQIVFKRNSPFEKERDLSNQQLQNLFENHQSPNELFQQHCESQRSNSNHNNRRHHHREHHAHRGSNDSNSFDADDLEGLFAELRLIEENLIKEFDRLMDQIRAESKNQAPGIPSMPDAGSGHDSDGGANEHNSIGGDNSDTGENAVPSEPVNNNPIPGKDATPVDAADALAGFQIPTDLPGPVFEPKFGNGKSDTKAIQEVVDRASAQGGGVVHIPSGTYNIDAANAGIIMKSNVTLVMEKDTILKAIPSRAESGCIIDVRNVNNVNIYGGKLIGDFGPGASHTGETMSGIYILGTSSNIDIQGVESDYNKGDGFDVKGTGSNIHLAHNVAIGNKRDGLSIEGGSKIVVEYNAFLNSGTADSYDMEVPEARRLPVSGIDIENTPDLSVNSVVIRNNLLKGNGNKIIDANTSNGWGIRVTGSNGKNSQVLDNTIADNAAGGIGVWSGSGNIISGNVLEDQPHPYSLFGGSATGDGNTSDGRAINYAK